MLAVRFEAVPELCVSDLPNVSSTHSGLRCGPPNLSILGHGRQKVSHGCETHNHVLT